MSIIYEVNVFVQHDIENEYREWLVKHIAEILALPGFIDAQSFDVLQEGNAGTAAICVHYRLESQAALDNYFEHHASRLRADGIARFGDRFRAARRVMMNPESFSIA
jgi:antibiotic biosynthesis monooxygenase (ABM) superfamily enzyme